MAKLEKFDVKGKKWEPCPGEYTVIDTADGTATEDGRPVTLTAQRTDTDTAPILLFTEQEMVRVVG